MLFKYIIVLILLLASKKGISQNYFLPKKVYITDSVGNDNSKIPQKFIFKINADSVLIYLTDSVKNPMIKFQIRKLSCEELQPGIYDIQIDVIREQNKNRNEAKLKIKYNYTGAFKIELLYPGKETRNFYIDQKIYFLKQKR